VRFRDLDSDELLALMVALAPHQYSAKFSATHDQGYCSKLGYARPLGWGSVRISVKAVRVLRAPTDDARATPTLVTWDGQWPGGQHPAYNGELVRTWLDLRRRDHPDAGDYPKGPDGKIYTYHTKLRAAHAQKRRYRKLRRP
jgi:hypothetical protein